MSNLCVPADEGIVEQDGAVAVDRYRWTHLHKRRLSSTAHSGGPINARFRHMPSAELWSEILDHIETYDAPDPAVGRRVHLLLIEAELTMGDVPVVRLAREAWRTLERALIERPRNDAERERNLCVAAIELMIDLDPDMRRAGPFRR